MHLVIICHKIHFFSTFLTLVTLKRFEQIEASLSLYRGNAIASAKDLLKDCLIIAAF